MDPDPTPALRLLAEVERIVATGGDDIGIAFPSGMTLEEAIRRLTMVPSGAAWEAIERALNVTPAAD